MRSGEETFSVAETPLPAGTLSIDLDMHKGHVASPSLITFTIQTDGTVARFYIDEILLGQDNTVVGLTSAVSGTIRVDPNDPMSTYISPIQIDARTLKTDSDTRNRSIQRRILLSALDENRYIVFQPFTLKAFPKTISVGDSFTFDVIGELKIRNVSRSASFRMEVTALSEQRLIGEGSTVIRYADYGIVIPNVEPVAGVEDEVRLEIDFTATATR